MKTDILNSFVPELHNRRDDLIEYFVVKVRKDCVPRGAKLVEAYLTERELICMGDPPDDDTHDCDALGCGSVGSHVIYRFQLPNTGLGPVRH